MMGWGLRIKKKNIMEVYWKIQLLEGGPQKKHTQYIGGMSTKGRLEQSADLRGDLATNFGWHVSTNQNWS